jgi:5'-nucleotidase
MARPLILVSNDDGITSRGILNLVNVMKELGEVIVVAPDGPQSGMGHAITVGDTLRLNEIIYF